MFHSFTPVQRHQHLVLVLLLRHRRAEFLLLLLQKLLQLCYLHWLALDSVASGIAVALDWQTNLLKNRLKQVQEMQLNCDEGLKHMTSRAPLLGPVSKLWKLKNPDISESEWAVQATAASIYSTCNMVIKTENVPFF